MRTMSVGTVKGLAATWPGRALLGAALVVAVGVPLLIARAGATPAKAELRTTPVARAAVTQTVAVSGSINAAGSVRLNFKSAGRLAEVYVKVGDQVQAGSPLAKLDTADLQVALLQAQANLASAQAKYDQTIAGASAEDVAVARQSVDNATRSLDQTRRSTDLDLSAAQGTLARTTGNYSTAKAGFTSLAAQARSDADQFMRNVEQAQRQHKDLLDSSFSFPSGNDIRTAQNSLGQATGPLATAASTATGSVRAAIAEHGGATNYILAATEAFDAAFAAGTDTAVAVTQYQSAQAAYSSAATKLTAAIDLANAQLSSALGSVTSAQASMNTSTSRGQIEYDSFRAALTLLADRLTGTQQQATSAKAKVSQAATSLQTVTDAVGGGLTNAQQAVASAQAKAASSLAGAENAVESARTSLSKTTAGAKSYDVASAYASLLAQQAAVDKAQNDLTFATLRSPIAGVVATLGAQVGEFVSGGGTANAFATVANTASLAVHGTVGEADVAKLKLGQVATVTVDAVGATTRMTGKVTVIDPVATIQQGVPVYGVDVTLDVPNPQVRPGMSGTANVILASRTDVLTVPNLAIRTQGSRRYVQVLRNGEAVDAAVTFGIANDSVTEVTAGLEEGDLVVLPQPRAATGGQQQPQGPGGVRIGPGGVPIR